MPIFDNLIRTDTCPAQYAEGRCAYYNRSARPEVTRVRELLECWIAAYPVDARNELIQRLREDFDSFDAAFFELYLYVLLTALGHHVRLHPVVPGTPRHPDFMAMPISGGEPCYVEAVIAGDQSTEQQTESDLQDRIQDDINAYRHPGFYFIIARLDGSPAEYPRRRDLHAFLAMTLDSLDPDDVAHRIEAGEDVSLTLVRRFSHRGLELELFPWPKSPEARGDARVRSVGAGPLRVHWSTARASVRTTVKGKAGRYGQLPHPYVIAVNCTSRWGVDDDDVRQALLGREEVHVPRGGHDAQVVYDGEGAFTHRCEPINTRVSAVLAFRGLEPSSILRADIRLYHHIAPRRAYAGPLDLLPQARRVGDTMEYFPGRCRSPEDLFGLPAEWPYRAGEAR